MTFNGLRKSSTTPPPAIGEHTEEVLRSVLGYSDAEIDRHRSEGAFGDMGAS
jgi:crotonobetainyl-CoA:carnitine CoA-transferase CaiB-like acyl-CoA transferase